MTAGKPRAARLPDATLATVRKWHTDRFGGARVEGPRAAEPVIVTGRTDKELHLIDRATGGSDRVSTKRAARWRAETDRLLDEAENRDRQDLIQRQGERENARRKRRITVYAPARDLDSRLRRQRRASP